MKNILAELKDVKLAVVVLSDAFFTRTKHPMSELSTIVDTKVQMLPVFYEFSVDEFKTKCCNQEWMATWKRWVDDKSISEDDVAKWKNALTVVSETNGLEYCKEATDTLQLRDKIVARVCCIMKPDLCWSDKSVQGMDRLCKVASVMFTESSQPTCFVDTENDSLSKQAVVGGMYGITGIGKSTLCRALCDYFFKEFKGRVCYIELGDFSEAAVRQRLSLLIRRIGSNCPAPVDSQLSVHQLWNLLTVHIQRCGSQPMFLAIDNVQLGESMDEAEKYLGCGPFPNGSKIFLTSQRKHILEDLLVGHNEFRSWVHRISYLSFAEARKIFLHKMYANENAALSPQQEHVVDDCVSMCTLNNLQSDYFPMMLIVLASYMWRSRQDALQCQGKLEELKRDGIFASTGIEKLERMLRYFYYSLEECQQHMLLDLALYVPDALNRGRKNEDVTKYWLDYIHPCQDENDILSQIVALSLVEVRGASVIHTDKCFHVHDLWREFLKKEGAKSCRWIFKENKKVKPSWRPRSESRFNKRIGISGCHFEVPTLDLSGITEIKVLHLRHNEALERVLLSKTAWICLESLIVHTSSPIKIVIQEPAPKQQQAFFYMEVENCEITSGASDPSSYLQNYPNSGLTLTNVVTLKLQNVQMTGQFGGCLGGFQQLQELELTDLSDLGVKLEFDMCRTIRQIILTNLPKLEGISGLENCWYVEAFSVKNCSSLHSLVLLDKHASYAIQKCEGLETIEVRFQTIEVHHPPKALRMLYDSRLDVNECPLMHNIMGLKRRRFIRNVSYEHNTSDCPPRKRLKCFSPEMIRQMFEMGECSSSEQQIGSATIISFKMHCESVTQVSMGDVHDTSSYISALKFTCSSSLESLDICCNRENCGCIFFQPHFDYFGLCLKYLSFECVSVRDLSSLENCPCMQKLGLYGCMSAVKWPNFKMMPRLNKLEVICPASLTYWPLGLQGHPFLKDVLIEGSNQIPPESLLEEFASEDDANCHWVLLRAAFRLFAANVKYSRKDALRIAKALLSSNEKLLSFVDGQKFWIQTYGVLQILCEILNGLWECSIYMQHEGLSEIPNGLWECSTYMQHEGLSEIPNGLWECVQALLSQKPLVSALLLLLSREGLWLYEEDFYPVVLVICCLSVEKFGVLPEEHEGSLRRTVREFFADWEETGRMPLPLWDRDLPKDDKRRSRKWLPWLLEHDLLHVRAADAMCRLRRRFIECDSSGLRYGETLKIYEVCKTLMLQQAVQKMYDTYHAKASAMNPEDSRRPLH